MYFFPRVTVFLQSIGQDFVLEGRSSPAFSNSASAWAQRHCWGGDQECPVINGAPWTIWLVQTWQVFQWARCQEQFGNIYKKRVLQLLPWDQMDLLLALACHMQSALSPFQHFCTSPWEPNPLDLCEGGNKLSSPLSSQSRLLSLVVSATIIRLNFGFGPGRVIQETSLCSLTGADWCHLVLPALG